MAFWDRVRDNIGWDRDRGDDRERWNERGWSGQDRDYDRPHDRGYGSDYGRSMGADRDYGRDMGGGGDHGRGTRHFEDRNYGYGSRDYNNDMNRDRWSSGRMNQGSYDDYDRGGYGMSGGRGHYGGMSGDMSGGRGMGMSGGMSGDMDRDRMASRNRDRGMSHSGGGYRGASGGSDFDRGGYGYDFGERHSSGRFSGGSMGRGNYDRTDFDFDRDRNQDRDRDRWRDDRDEWDRNRNRW